MNNSTVYLPIDVYNYRYTEFTLRSICQTQIVIVRHCYLGSCWPVNIPYLSVTSVQLDFRRMNLPRFRKRELNSPYFSTFPVLISQELLHNVLLATVLSASVSISSTGKGLLIIQCRCGSIAFNHSLPTMHRCLILKTLRKLGAAYSTFIWC